MQKKKIIILGSTGSIGSQALEVIEQNLDLFDVVALVAGTRWEALAKQAIAIRPKMVAIFDAQFVGLLESALSGTGIAVLSGEGGVCEAARQPSDIVLAAMVGMSGLKPTLASLEGTRSLAIANKESVVVGGRWLLDAAHKMNVQVLPVDSEHNGLFQLLQSDQKNNIHKLILTASGGPFRGFNKEQLKHVTVEQALKHPNWSMGPKNTIDSATLFNKGLEVIEACRLFDFPSNKVEAWVHPQSFVHAVLEFKDGTQMFQISRPSMKLPIAHALSWPERYSSDVTPLNFDELSRMVFEPIDDENFPAVRMARACLKSGMGACIVYNVANECAVNAFLDRRISFLKVMTIVQEVLDKMMIPALGTIDEAMDFAEEVKVFAANAASKMF